MTDDERWLAVVARDPAWDGKFFYCVKTTKIFCRPTCKARLARRANVEFYNTPAEAQAAGYRACKRCQPLLASYTPEADKIKKVCDILDTLPETAPLPGLDKLSAEAGLTKHHFHRLFKRETGLTPRQYAIASRRSDTNSESTSSTAMTPITPVTHNIETPFIADDEFFALPNVDPLLFGGEKDLSAELEAFVVYYRIIETTFGLLLVAFLNQQVCKLELGMSEPELLEILEATFPSSYYLHSPVELADGGDAVTFRQRIEAVVEALENPSGKVLDIPASLRLDNMMGEDATIMQDLPVSPSFFPSG